MPHELNASIQVTLPDDPRAMAMAIAKVTSAWAEMLNELPDGAQSALTINETRAKAAATNGTRAPRRTREQIAADKAAAAETRTVGPVAGLV